MHNVITIVSTMSEVLSECILSASPGLLAVHDLAKGSCCVNFKNSAHTLAESSTSAVSRYRKTTGYVTAKDGLAGLIVTLGGQGKGSINNYSFAKVCLPNFVSL